MAVKQGGIQHFTVQEAGNVNLGQGGSVYLDTNGTTFTPSVGVVIAITCLTTVDFDVLTPEDPNKYFGIGAAGYEGKGDTLASGNNFATGVTIYGRWTSVSIDDSGDRCICYIGS